MFNNPLIDKEAKLKIAEREHEAETYRLQKQLGYSDRRIMNWVFGFLTLIVVLILMMILI